MLFTFTQNGATVSGTEDIAGAQGGVIPANGVFVTLSSQITGTVAANALTFTDVITQLGTRSDGLTVTCHNSSSYTLQVTGATASGLLTGSTQIACTSTPPGFSLVAGISPGLPNPMTMTRQ